MIEVEVVADVPRFQSLRAEWSSLVERSGSGTPFLSHEWFSCCIEAFGSPRTPWIVLARESGVLIGAAPFWRERAASGFRKPDTISFITCPETPYSDFITQADRREAAIEAILQLTARANDPCWDLLVLAPWPEGSPHRTVVERILTSLGRPWYTSVASRIPRVLVEGTWDEYWNSRSLQYRKGYRRIRNRIRELPHLEVRRHRDAGDPTLWTDLIAVSERSWKAGEGVAIVSHPAMRRFFELLTERAGARGWLLVWVLRSAGRPIAMEYDLVSGGVIFALRADFDREFESIGPGRYLEVEILERTFTEGYREYNCGPGISTYKLRLTDRVDTNLRVTVCNGTLRGRADWLWWGRLRPWLRRFKPKGRAGGPADGAETGGSAE